MKNLIFTKDNSIEPNGAIGIQKCGIIFWQKTGFLRHCNQLGLKSIVALINKKFSPSSIDASCDNIYFIYFDNDEEKTIYLTLKKERNSKHLFIYGESHTVYADAEFHILALEIVSYIAKQIGTKFFVDDATGYLEHRSKDQLEQYIKEYMLNFKSVVSNDLLRESLTEHQNRPLDMTVDSRCGLHCTGCEYKESCGCGGCIETNGHPFYGECPVAVCCQDRGFKHCGECPDIPCKQLYAYSYLDKEHGDDPPGARIEQCRRWCAESKGKK